ncbi:tRNA (adenosine(37)-N6)-threonylcarbamoyltransferase complex transferase subunit TsaD [soil metagenome]
MTRTLSTPRAALTDPASTLILGIDSSCDETAAAVLRGPSTVLSNIIASQNELHAPYRGVVPEIASRAHAERIGTVIISALAAANVTFTDLHAIAVGNRPGLIGALLVGVSAAKALAWSLDLPLVAVDHVHAHLIAGLLNPSSSSSSSSGAGVPPASSLPAPTFPALGLVVSGGHTALFRLTSPTDLTLLGSTRDDAVGEAYDKVAAILNLPYPGGPLVDQRAQRGDPATFPLPISRLEEGSLDFSFSGLKTAVLYTARGLPPHRNRPATPPMPPTETNLNNLCASFQHAAIDALLLRLARAAHQHPDCNTLLAGGGVTANSLLRARLQQFAAHTGLGLFLPQMQYCVDNAAMIAALGHRTLLARDWQSDPLTTSATPSGHIALT